MNLLKTTADYIILAGFLWKIPRKIIDAFPNKIINIHPALLPKYGGKGMYGMYVHRAILENKEIETGITIHYVNEQYDEGEFIAQHKVNIQNCTTAEEIAAEVHQLEHQYFPSVIEKIITQNPCKNFEPGYLENFSCPATPSIPVLIQQRLIDLRP